MVEPLSTFLSEEKRAAAPAARKSTQNTSYTMAKLTPGMKQDWKHRPANGGRPMKRMVRLLMVGTLFLILLGVLIWFLLPPSEQRTYFFAADPVEYDLWATIPLVHSSVADTLAQDGNHDPRSFHMGSVALEETFSPINQLAAKASGGSIPGRNDACVIYLQAHTLRYDVEGEPHVVVATPTFLRNSLANWQSRGVLPLSVVLDWIAEANSPLKLVLLDAGTIVSDSRIDLMDNNFTSALETEMKNRDDSELFLITSHESGQKSLSLSLQHNTIFSQAVQEAFSGKGIVDISADGSLSLDELYHHICVRVKNHIGDGVIAQTPRLFQGGQGILTESFPATFVCRYFQEEPSEETKDASPSDTEEKKTAATPKPEANSEKKDDKQKSAEEPKDPRWVTLNEVWQLRDQLAQPPAARGEMIWSPVDFAPQYFRRLDNYLIGYQFRLLFSSGSVPEEKLAMMKSSLETLQSHIRDGRQVETIPPLSDTPADNLIESWNQFVDSPYQLAWSADLTLAGQRTRDAILGWNYCVYHVPQVTQMFEHTGSDSTLAGYQSLLQDIRDVTIGMLEVPPSGSNGPELANLPLANVVSRALGELEGMRRYANADMTITPRNPEASNLNAQMADALRLIGYLRTSLPKAADRQRMAQSLKKFAEQPIPDYTFIDNADPFLPQLSTAALPHASPASMDKLRELYLQIATAGSPLPTSSQDPFVSLGNTVPAEFPTDSDYHAQVRYQVRVRTLDWRDMTQIVGEVPPLPFRFPVKVKTPYLAVRSGSQQQQVELDRIDGKTEFQFQLLASNFPPGPVNFQVEYDRDSLDVSFENGSFDSSTGMLNYTIDASGPINIQGTVSAKLDREANARRKNLSDIQAAQQEAVRLTIPPKYVSPDTDASPTSVLNVSLPWAEVVELIVQQVNAQQPGIFYGQRVQIPLFDNRESEFQLGILNRSRINRKVNVSLYPVVRPETSVMPTGRIFSDQYHRKPLSGGPDSQAAEIAPWKVASYERLKVNLGPDFLPTAVATGVEAPSYDQVPPPATRARGRIINEAVAPERCQWLRFTGPTGPPAADGKPVEPKKIASVDLTNGLLVVIEDQENKDAAGKPVTWMRWIEWVPRDPQSYLEVQPSVLPADKLSRLEVIVRPITGERALPTATWDEHRLAGYLGLPSNLAKVPIRVEWDWKWENTFDASELIKRQSFGTIASPDATATLGAILNLQSTKPVKRPILLDIASGEKLPTLRRAFRDVMNLNTGQLDADASAGFEALRLDSYVPHIEGAMQPPVPIDVMASRWPADRFPIILPTESQTVDWNLAVSTDTNSFNGASEINPDKIQLGLLERGNGFESARLNFTETLYSNRSFTAELTKAQAEGPLVITSTLQDITVKGLSDKTYETFNGDFVVEIFNGRKIVDSLRIPVVIDKDAPVIDIDPSPMTVPVNGSATMTIPAQDKDSGIKYLEYGDPGPGDTIGGKPARLEPLVGNIVPNANDPFHRFPQFQLQIRPTDLKWEVGTTHKLRVLAVNGAGLKSKPLDLVVRVGPKMEDPMDNPMQLMVIKTQIVFVNGKATTDRQYKPKIKELPIQPRLDNDGITWVFESALLKPDTNYTLQTSGRQSSGGIKSTETVAQATPVKERAPIYRLQFD